MTAALFHQCGDALGIVGRVDQEVALIEGGANELGVHRASGRFVVKFAGLASGHPEYAAIDIRCLHHVVRLLHACR